MVDDVNSHVSHCQAGECPQADHAPTTSLPHSSLKIFPWKPSGSSDWALAVPNFCTAHYNKRCTFLPHNPMSVDRLYCAQTSGPKFGSVTEVFLYWCRHLSSSSHPSFVYLFLFAVKKNNASVSIHTSNTSLRAPLCLLLFMSEERWIHTNGWSRSPQS